MSRFLDIAQGSAYEVRSRLFIARDLKYITWEKFKFLDNQIVEVSKMLNSLNKKLTANN
ncbi:MAG: four helix bundle protein [Xenococcaceae cyanobacterium MO_207.B15]|nr:four helix bundle protein [Xenococcaceae cyanobacterium MO_207.B15]